MSARDEELAVVVAELGALPVPAGDVQPLSAVRLAEIEGRAAHLYEYRGDADVVEWNALAGSDVPALVAEVRRLLAERHETNEWVDDAAKGLRAAHAQREALMARLRVGQRWQPGRRPPLVSQDFVSQDELRAMFGIPLVAPWDEPSEDPCHPCGCPKRFNRHADGCPTLPEGEFYGALHHGYAKGRDLPAPGGA